MTCPTIKSIDNCIDNDVVSSCINCPQKSLISQPAAYVIFQWKQSDSMEKAFSGPHQQFSIFLPACHKQTKWWYKVKETIILCNVYWLVLVLRPTLRWFFFILCEDTTVLYSMGSLKSEFCVYSFKRMNRRFKKKVFAVKTIKTNTKTGL